MAGQVQGQVINGQLHKLYTPEWYAAREAANRRAAGATGGDVGTQAGAAITALRSAHPDLFNAGSSSSSSSTSSGTGTSVPRVGGIGGGGTGGGGGVPGGGGGGGSVPNVARAQVPDTSAADAAIFGRAKDQAGELARGALTGLRSALGSRGQLGGGGEFRGTQNIVQSGLGQLGEVSRELAIQNAQRGADFAALGYQGDITQRGQDLSSIQSANELANRLALAQYQGDITQRGQDIDLLRTREAQSKSASMENQLILDRILNSLQFPSLY